MKQFFTSLWDKEGVVYVAKSNHKKGTPEEWEQKTYRYPDELDSMIKWLKNSNRTCSVYFCPLLFKGDGRRVKGNALPTSDVIWVDKDKGNLEDLTPTPTVCWQTSDGKYQALWKLDKEYDLDVIEDLCKQVTAKTRSDKSGWDLGQMLRVPETLNHKYFPAYRGILMWSNKGSYKPEDIVPIKEVNEIVEEVKNLEKAPPLPAIVPSFSDALIAHGRRIPKKAWELLQGNCDNPEKAQDSSGRLWDLECLLVEAGIPVEYVFAITKDSPWNKYQRDNRPDANLWNEVWKNFKQHEGKIVSPESDELVDLPWMELDRLLTYAERPEWLVEDIWMAKNVGWMAGEGKSYKSVLSLDMALSIASGTPFLGKYRVNDPGTVLMVQEEDPTWRVAHRIQAMAAYKGIENMEMALKDGMPVFRMNETKIPLFISIGGKLTFTDEPRMEALERAIDRRRPKMVILDPMFMMAAGMDEFKAGEMAQILNTLKQWRNAYECAIAIVHHFRKTTGADTQKLYGSMALYAWSENSLLVQRESRDNNVVNIRRDIKDAPSDDKISVEFLNIDDEYKFMLREAIKDNNPSITGALKGYEVGDELSIKDLQDLTGMSDKSIRKNIKDLEEQELIITDRRGRGGALKISPTERLLSEPTEGMIFG